MVKNVVKTAQKTGTFTYQKRAKTYQNLCSFTTKTAQSHDYFLILGNTRKRK